MDRLHYALLRAMFSREADMAGDQYDMGANAVTLGELAGQCGATVEAIAAALPTLCTPGWVVCMAQTGDGSLAEIAVFLYACGHAAQDAVDLRRFGLPSRGDSAWLYRDRLRTLREEEERKQDESATPERLVRKSA